MSFWWCLSEDVILQLIRATGAEISDNFDPYQIFEVQHSPCLILTVKVIKGRNITLGFRDLLDTPDPYVNLVVKNSPDGKKSTTVKENCTSPEWNETFTFFLNFSQANILEISLMESNYLFDINVGTVNFDVARIREMDKSQFETVIFNDISEVDIELKLEFDQNPTLRYSLCLSDAEKNFLTQRKEKVTNGIKKLLGDSEGPNSLNEVPTIAVIGSGGGFRAMTGYSGVFKALVESGVLDCTTYACGLSGSSWLLSSLYSHPKWPNMDMDEFLDELKNSIDKSLLRFFNASTIYNYAKFMVQKRKEGQPVSFTDIFGRMVGETLLNGRMESTLSDQREKIKGGSIPMPLYTCVHVKKDVPAKSFQEWVEFSPYEIGMPKYGTFMDSELFGSKFFMGKLVKKYKEQPLHFLQGIWGSAFCVLFRRLLEDNRRIDPAEMMRLELGKEMKKDEAHLDQTEMIRQEMNKELEEEAQESSSDPSDDDDDDDEDDSCSSDTSLERDDGENQDTDVKTSDSMPLSSNTSWQENLKTPSINKRSATMEDVDKNSVYKGDSCDKDDTSMLKEVKVDLKPPLLETEKFQTSTMQSNMRKSSLNPKSPRHDLGENSKKTVNWGECPTREIKNIHEKRQAYTRAGSSFRKSKGASKSYWKKFLQGIFESNSWEFLTTRRGRAAVIHNFMRGLNLQQTYPLSPFTPLEQRVKEGDVFDGIFEMHPTSVKHIYMVDAGLTYNSPYPLVLRPQRQIDIILSFDFSARETDVFPPFKELILAEKWAKLNRLPFPPIDTSVFQREGMKELYIFRHPTDPHCPIVFHFVLINKTFKNYKAPGVPRETKEEFDFANFDVFDDPKAPFSTFNFTYTHHNFERLSKLMEFNTLLHIEDIKQAIRDVLRAKREGPPRVLIQSKDIKLLRLKSVQEMRKLKKFISRMEASSTHSNSTPSPQFYTPQPHSVSTGNPFFSTLSKTEIPCNNAAGCTSPTSNLLRNVTMKNSHHLSNFDEPDCVSPDRRRLFSSSSCESVFGTPPQSCDHLHKSDNRCPLNNDVNENIGVTSSFRDQVLTGRDELVDISSPRKTSAPKNNLSQLHFNKDSGVSMSFMHTSPIELAPPHNKTNKESPPNPFFVKAHMRSCFGNSSSPVGSPFHYSNNLPDRSTTGEDNKISSLVNKPETISQISVEEFHTAPEAFKADGTPVIDSTEAKMYYENAKAKRKLLRRQSTITSLNSISLDETCSVIKQENLDYDHHVFNGNDSAEISKFIGNAIPRETQNFDDISDLSVFTGTVETKQ
ncbi:Cytosolic phospholipase A2 [Bulinus truncatus]|nr:Cytosolic phospholipase A2 [Bulinus truncatus]